MALLLDEDFQSYTVGQGPPYGTLLWPYSGSPSVANSIVGVFGDAKELSMSGADVLFPVTFLSLSHTLPAFSQFSVFHTLFVQANNSSSAGTLISFNWNDNPFGGVSVAAIQVLPDGTVGISNDIASIIPNAVSDLAIKQNGWYQFRTDIVFSNIGSVCYIDCQVYVNGVLWVTYNGPQTVNFAAITKPYINNVVFGGAGGGSFIGRLAVYDTIQASGFYPHPGTPEARITQGVIELILSATTADIVAACPVTNTGTVGTAFSAQLQVTDATGTPPNVWALTAGAFPDGLTLDTTTGIISGTPTLAGVFNWTVTVTDFQGDVSDPIDCTTTIAIAVTCPPAAETTIYSPYSSNSGISGQTGSVTWSISAGALPTGLSLNTSTGNIHGASTALG